MSIKKSNNKAALNINLFCILDIVFFFLVLHHYEIVDKIYCVQNPAATNIRNQ